MNCNPSAFRIWSFTFVMMSVFSQICLGQTAVTASESPETAPHDSYQPTLTFDVASIRVSPQAESYRVGYRFVQASSAFSATNMTVRNLISDAYSFPSDQIVNLPAERTMYMIEAKGDSSADERLRSLNVEQRHLEQQHMVQDLLAERFHLKTHWEMRTGPTYDLVVGKSGIKMSQAREQEPLSAEEAKTWGGNKFPPIYQRGSSDSSFSFIGHGCSTKELSGALASQFGHPVMDKTALTGKYDFKLQYHDTWLTDRPADDTNPIPPLDTAIQDQLGLKIVPSKGEERVLVIDHIEKPSEN